MYKQKLNDYLKTHCVSMSGIQKEQYIKDELNLTLIEYKNINENQAELLYKLFNVNENVREVSVKLSGTNYSGHVSTDGKCSFSIG